MRSPAQAEHIREWTAALRSGKYSQATHALHKVTEEGEWFCCLGVACDLFQEPLALRKELQEKLDGGDPDHYMYSGIAGTLPLSVQRYLGIEDRGRFVQIGKTTTLTNLNDEGKTFAEIADIIEKEFLS